MDFARTMAERRNKEVATTKWRNESYRRGRQGPQGEEDLYRVAGVARKVKKAYIGVGGVARIFWSGGELAYYGTATALSSGRTYHAAATVGNYALFGGGYSYSSGYMTTVDAYSASLIRSTPTALSEARYDLAGVAVGELCLIWRR